VRRRVGCDGDRFCARRCSGRVPFWRTQGREDVVDLFSWPPAALGPDSWIPALPLGPDSQVSGLPPGMAGFLIRFPMQWLFPAPPRPWAQIPGFWPPPWDGRFLNTLANAMAHPGPPAALGPVSRVLATPLGWPVSQYAFQCNGSSRASRGPGPRFPDAGHLPGMATFSIHFPMQWLVPGLPRPWAQIPGFWPPPWDGRFLNRLSNATARPGPPAALGPDSQVSGLPPGTAGFLITLRRSATKQILRHYFLLGVTHLLGIPYA